MKRPVLTAIWIAVVIAATATLVYFLPGCAGAPHSIGQLEQMDEASFQEYLDGTVGDWSLAAGIVVATEAPSDVDATLRFCADLDAIAEGVITPHAIRDLAKAVHWDSPAVPLLMIAGQALLARHGGLPGGEHGKRLLHAIAQGVRDGMAIGAQPEPTHR